MATQSARRRGARSLSLEEAAAQAQRLCEGVGRALRGKPEVVRRAVETLIAGGHLLLEDVPGVGKTTLAHALARCIDASFRRIQFTSDLLPADLIGSALPETHAGLPTGGFRFQPGPLFAHVCSRTRSTARARRCSRRCSRRWASAR